MKKVLFIFIVVFSCLSVVNAQTYNKVKVTLKSGLVQKGSKATISDESISFKAGNEIKTYPLSEVSMVQAKSGNAGKWALGCGAGCLAVEAISWAAIGNSGVNDLGYTTGQMAASVVLWIGISAGVGYLIGSLTDHEEIVYNKNLSLLNSMKLNVTTDRLTNLSPKVNNLTLAIRF